MKCKNRMLLNSEEPNSARIKPIPEFRITKSKFATFLHILQSLMHVSASNNIKHGGNLLGWSA